MFIQKVSRHESFSKHRAGKTGSKRQRSFKNSASFQRFEQAATEVQHQQQNISPQVSPSLTSAIITLCVGREQRLFAAHEDVLCNSPYFASLCRNQYFESTRRIDLPEDEPEIFSSVLEYLYKGDYYPRLELDKRRRTWQLENMDTGAGSGTVESTVFVNGLQVVVLKDTVIYVCPTNFESLHPTSTDTCHSAQPRSMASLNFNGSLFANRDCNQASNAAPFSLLPGTRTHTRPTVTLAYVPTTLHSSFAADTHSSVVEQCKWRWKPGEDYFLICSLRSLITSTIYLASHHAKSVICLVVLVIFQIYQPMTPAHVGYLTRKTSLS